MRLSLLILVLLALSQTPALGPRKIGQPQKQQSAAHQQPSNGDQRGTEQSPLVVKTLETPKTKTEAEQEAADRQQKATNDERIVALTAILAAIAFGQLGIYLYQAIKLRETVRSTGEQSKSMERHIGEAARSANAMEEISDVIQSGNKATVRAYISIIIGTAVYQVRQDGIKFEGKPSLVNTGSTPARNVHIRIAAEITRFDQANDFAYPMPDEVARAPAVCAPHQTYILSAMVKDFAPDADIPFIKHGTGQALTVWGVVTYDDIFGEHHTTKFGQWLFWYPNQTVYGYYIPGQNDMD